MAKLVGVYDEEEEVLLLRRQLPLTVYDSCVMTMQLGESCERCEVSGGGGVVAGRRRWDETFGRQYGSLSKEEVVAAFTVPSKLLFTRLAQTVACVGCRRSVERLFNQLRVSGHPALEPLLVTPSGALTLQRKCAVQTRTLGSLFTDHSLSLSSMLDNIPKLKKSGRCVLHSMEGVRCRPGGRSWREVWGAMDQACRESVTLVCPEQLLTTLDNYLRKHRFCQECKNKVHRAYDILVGPGAGSGGGEGAKDKGYVAALYAGLRRCEAKGHIHIPADTDYVTHLITRAEPELQGRRERHAKTLEIAQEEVLTCLGLFLYERLQKVHTRLREEEQTWDILFHVALDTLRRNFELYVEDKQGYSKFEQLCEELQRQELREKAKKEKKKKRKKNKKNEEGKENTCLCEDEAGGCRECELNLVSPCPSQRATLINATNKQVGSEVFCRGGAHLVPPLGPPHVGNGHLHPPDQPGGGGRGVGRCGAGGGERGSSEEKESCDSSPDPYHTHHHHHHHHSHHSPTSPHAPHPLECTASTDSLVSRCSQGSRDGGYCSAQGSSRDSSEVACGEGLCAHPPEDPLEDPHPPHHDPDPPTTRPFTLSLQQMLDDSRCEDEEIPEAEVQAWRARLNIVEQKRAELRQTLRQRFQQLCHRGCAVATPNSGVGGQPHLCPHHPITTAPSTNPC